MKKIFRKIKFKISKIFFKEEYKKMVVENFYNGIDKLLSLIFKNWKGVFLGIVLLFEFMRKLYLYNAGVPLFVLNNESILNIASYGFTIIIIFILFIILFFLLKIIEILVLKDSKILSLLGKIISSFLGIIMVLIIIVSLNKPIGVNQDNEMIYINDIYQVVKKDKIIQVYDKKNKIFYQCFHANSYNDNCKELR